LHSSISNNFNFRSKEAIVPASSFFISIRDSVTDGNHLNFSFQLFQLGRVLQLDPSVNARTTIDNLQPGNTLYIRMGPFPPNYKLWLRTSGNFIPCSPRGDMSFSFLANLDKAVCVCALCPASRAFGFNWLDPLCVLVDLVEKNTIYP
jgi:hypothetical protein